jgi:hypothetical protein
LDYHCGGLDENTADRVRSHLPGCPACQTALFDAAAFTDAGPAAVDLAKEWRRFEERLFRPKRSGFRSPGSLAPLSIAAALLIGIGLTASWTMQKQRALQDEVAALRTDVIDGGKELARLKAPQADIDVFDVFPAEPVARSARSQFKNRITPRHGAGTTWIVSASAIPSLPLYAVDLVRIVPGPVEVPVWRIADARRDAHGNFALAFPPGFLSPGRYTLRVSSTGDGARPLSEYIVDISK